MNYKQVLHLVMLLLATQSAMADPLPYRAVVQTATAPVRSGPGHDFYPTSELSKGQVVEVYRHKNDDWCAIRPPAGSFSWVRAAAVRATEDPSVVKVAVDGARTRVGSQLHTAYNVAYVKLREGETLKTQGRPVNLPGTSRLAYRVDPPSGEFRWIRRQFLAKSASATHQATMATESRELLAPIKTDKPPAPNSDDAPTGSGVVQASHQGELQLKKLTDGGMATFPIPTQGRQQPIERDEASQPDEPAGLISDLQRQLDQIDLRLTQVVTEPVSQWNLRPLRSKLDRIVEHSGDSSAIKRATQLLVRISDFDRLQERHEELSGNGTPDTVSLASDDTAITNAPWRTVPTPPSAPQPETSSPPDFSGQGWLIPVFTKRRDLPRFALTDDDGAILYFVSPSSGLNLRRYLRTRIGIFGSVTETTSAEPPQLVAKRVVVLDRHQR